MPMPVPTRRLACVVALVAGLPLAVGQQTTPIDQGRTHSGVLSGAGGASYTLTVEAGTFVTGVAEQVSVDVVVSVSGPDGGSVGRFDGPGEGPERFQFTAEERGEYTIRVEPFEGASGGYTLNLTRVEPVATDPGKRVGQLMTAYDSMDTPGGAIAVYREGELIFAEGYGAANLEHGVAWGPETVTNIGSTSKQFTAMAIGLLANEGKLTLDDDIREHLPELPDLGHVVTVRNLLTHTTGYREYLNLLAMGGRQIGHGDVIRRDEIIPMLQRQPELQNEPGAEWNYNNTSFSLLTQVVERISGQPFEGWMDEHVFSPLGMEHTYVRADRRTWMPNRATGYAGGEGGVYLEAIDLGASMGAGGVYSTVEDLGKWIENYHTATLGGEAWIEEMATPYVLTDGKPTGYGLGLFIDDLDGLERLQHGGADTAHRSMVMFFPGLNAGVITQSNNGSFDGGIANEVARLFFGGEMASQDEAPAAAASSESDGMSVGPDGYGELVGDYQFEEMPGFTLSITMNEGKLYGQGTGQPRLSFEPTSGTTFKVAGEEIRVRFEVAQDGTCESIMLLQNGEHKANRQTEDAWAPTADGLGLYAGRYFSEELEAFYTLVVEEGALKIEHRRFEVRLKPSNTHEFTGGYPVSKAEFVTDDEGNVTGLKASNGRTRDIWFERLD